MRDRRARVHLAEVGERDIRDTQEVAIRYSLAEFPRGGDSDSKSAGRVSKIPREPHVRDISRIIGNYVLDKKTTRGIP